MEIDKKREFEGIGKIFSQRIIKKAPAHEWQDLALSIINELRMPNFKRSSVFKACRDNDKQFILNCLNDTKELCKSGESWKYFFKLVSAREKERKASDNEAEQA